jgi:hypothetical protein
MAEAANACNAIFMEEMFKEIEALKDGEVVKTTPYRLFIAQMIQAAIKGQHAREETGAGFYEQAGGAGDRRFGSAGRRGASTPPTPPSATSPSVFSPCSDSSAPPSA